VRALIHAVASIGACALGVTPTYAGQAPGAAAEPDVLISHRDRVYAAEPCGAAVVVKIEIFDMGVEQSLLRRSNR